MMCYKLFIFYSYLRAPTYIEKSEICFSVVSYYAHIEVVVAFLVVDF